MRNRSAGVAVSVCLLAAVAGCTSKPTASSTSGLPRCTFKVGDSIVRGSVGAAVPKPGSGVVANGDGVNGSSELDITTSKTGVVTIKAVSSQPGTSAGPTVERCQLP